MEPFDNDQPQPQPPRRPSPPSSIPPLPPPPELLKGGAAPHVPLTPMMDFLQRRLEALEKELLVEREKARSAQGLIQQQESLKAEVERQLQTLSEQVRREKTERESEESKQHARGRIDSLEKRLDEMHQSWVGILKETVGAEGQAATRQELTVLAGTMNALIERMGEWRRETQQLVTAVPHLQQLGTSLPADSKRLEGQVAQMLAQFSVDVREQMAAWQRRQELEGEKLEERLRQLSKEKELMQRAWEEQNHHVRTEHLKERMAREADANERVTDLALRLDKLAETQTQAAIEAKKTQDGLRRVLDTLLMTPKAKDELLAAAEQEKLDLVKALKERTESMQKYGEERREVERTMGETMVALNRQVDDERKKNITLSSRISDLELRIASLGDVVESKERLSADKDAKSAALTAERDGLAKALVAEAARVREMIEQRQKADEDWGRQLDELRTRLTEETTLRARESVTVSELRAQLSTLTDHLSRALQEKDAATARVAGWDQERAKLEAALREKEEMITMLNSTFQSMLKTSPTPPKAS